MANTDKRIDELSNLSSLTGDELVILQNPTTLEYGKTTLANVSAKSPVTSVAGKTGAVSLTKDDVGLSNVENTADVNKPISSATQAALNAKEGTINPGNTGQYFRGDKTWQALDKSAVGLGNVDNTNDLSKPISTATQTALDTKATTTALDAHTNSTSNPHNVTKAQVGLGNVDNTSDANKPVSTAQQTALNGKQDSDATLTALAAHNTNGILTQTAADTFTGRTITGTANQVNVTNGNGVAGNPTLSLPQDIHTGASPTFSGINLSSINIGGAANLRNFNIKGSGINARLSIQGTTTTDQPGIEFTNDSNANRALIRMDSVSTTGTSLSIFTEPVSGSVTERLIIDENGNTKPAADSTYTLGTSSQYWKETYTDKLFLNSTATLDGSTTGDLNVTANRFRVSNLIDIGVSQGAEDRPEFNFRKGLAGNRWAFSYRKASEGNEFWIFNDISGFVNAFKLTQAGKLTITSDYETTSATGGVILKSPDGTRWKLTIANDGSVTTTTA